MWHRLRVQRDQVTGCVSSEVNLNLLSRSGRAPPPSHTLLAARRPPLYWLITLVFMWFIHNRPTHARSWFTPYPFIQRSRFFPDDATTCNSNWFALCDGRQSRCLLTQPAWFQQSSERTKCEPEQRKQDVRQSSTSLLSSNPPAPPTPPTLPPISVAAAPWVCDHVHHTPIASPSQICPCGESGFGWG
jgi:hypothetical protein